jgi:hypothetical protein
VETPIFGKASKWPPLATSFYTCIMIKIITLAILLGFCFADSNAQQNIVVAGNSASGSGGHISYTIGQVDYVSLTGNTNAGVQQAYYFVPVPITWLSFTATRQGKMVLLNWATASEINSDRFVVLHSLDGTVFTPIGNVTAAGNSSNISRYSLEHQNPAKGINYYRIKQVDKDGKFTFSNIAAVNFDADVSITCYPNPTKAILSLQIGNRHLKGYSYTLTDMQGKLLGTSKITNPVTSISMTSLKAATYILSVFDDKGKAISFIIVKE